MKCDICAADKKPCKTHKAPLGRMLVGTPLNKFATDILRVGPLPYTPSGNRCILVVTDAFTKWVEVINGQNLADDIEPIRALTRKDTDWKWSSSCERALETVKKKLTESPVLAYFDSNKEVELQVDSSQDGIGTVLMQNGKPIKYASQTLSPSERNWEQIKKEILSVAYSLERFDQYTFGVSVSVQNDHKPLASILRKPMSQTPKRLQAFLMQIHRYDVDFRFMKGTDLVVADALSRASIKTDDIRPRILNVNVFVTFDWRK